MIAARSASVKRVQAAISRKVRPQPTQVLVSPFTAQTFRQGDAIAANAVGDGAPRGAVWGEVALTPPRYPAAVPASSRHIWSYCFSITSY